MKNVKFSMAKNTNPLGGRTQQNFRMLGAAIEQKAKIYELVENEDVSEYIQQGPLTEAASLHVHCEEEKVTTLERAARYDMFVERTRAERFQHPRPEKVAECDTDQKARAWEKTYWLKKAMEDYFEEEHQDRYYEFARLVLKNYTDSVNVKYNLYEGWPANLKIITDQLRKFSNSINEMKREQKVDECAGCNMKFKGARGLTLHLGMVRRRIKDGEQGPNDIKCIQAYNSMFPLQELQEDELKGRHKANKGDQAANEPWRKEPWKFKCPVPKEIAANCNFPRIGPGATWCILCRIRENYDPEGCEIKNERNKAWHEKNKEHLQKTGNVRVPHQAKQENDALKKTACPNNGQGCQFPIVEKWQQWCIVCKYMRGRGGNPGGQQAPQAP